MDSRSVIFLEVMIGIAVVGLVAFLIVLVARAADGRREAEAGGADASSGPKWYELLMALILVIVVAAIVVWQLPPLADQAAEGSDWRTDARSQVFFVVMLVAAALGLVVFVVFLFVRAERRPAPAPAAAAAGVEAAAEQPGVATPSATRLLGLLALALAFLLLNWIYVPKGQQYAMMLYLIYPAGLALALVLLFDKASRAWSVKGAAETAREWLFCDAITFLFVLGFLNLLQSAAADKYAAQLWDFVYVVLFLLVFWIVDRKVTRYRFLVAHGYLVLLPILLLIWRTAQAVPAPKELSWWGSIWPVFFLAVIFSVLEVIALVAARESEKHVVPAVKDAVFLAIYGLLLIAAVPEAAT